MYVDFESFGNDMTYSINTLNSSYNNLVDEIVANEEVFSAALTDLNEKITENNVRDYISGTIDPSINKLETHLEKTDSSIVILNSSVSNLESHISKTDTSVSTLNSSVDVLETHVSEIDTSIGTLNSSISNLETHISNTDASVSTLDSSVDALETHVSEIDTSIGTLNSSVSTFETHISNIDSSISTLNSSVNVLEIYLEKTDSSIVILNSSVSDLETHISNIDTSVSTLDSSLNELNTSLGQLYVDFDAFGNDVTYSINTLNSSYNNLVDEIIANEEVVAAAITDLDKKIAENDVRDYISGTIDPSINKLETEIVLHGNKLNNYADTFPQNPVASSESNGLMSAADKTKLDHLAIDTLWEGQHMNDFTMAGEYHIHGIRTRDNDGLPIINSGDGHTIDARLTVLDSSLKNGTGAKTDICVTQILRLSNHTGGDGHIFVRTGQATTKPELTDSTKWSAWEKLMGLFEKSVVTNIDDLNTYTTNGMYSGMFMNAESKSLGGLQFNQGDTFLIVTVNGYAASAVGTAQLTQMLYLLPTKKDNATAKMYMRTAYWNVGVTPKKWEFANWDRIVTASELSALEARLDALETRVGTLEAK